MSLIKLEFQEKLRRDPLNLPGLAASLLRTEPLTLRSLQRVYVKVNDGAGMLSLMNIGVDLNSRIYRRLRKTMAFTSGA